MELLKLQKFNKIITGIVLGTVIPAILYFTFILPKIKHYSFMGEFYEKLIIKSLPLFLSRCIFPNALLFFIFLWINHNRSAKGMLIITAILTAALLIVNFFL